MRRSRLLFIRTQTAALAALFAAALAPLSAQAWTYKVLYNFCARSSAQADCTDGADPRASLLVDAAGNIYGTTSGGGKIYHGTVFELMHEGRNWRHHVLASPRTADGMDSRLIMDVSGNLYATSSFGGRSGYLDGAAYELVRPQAGGKWKTKRLYTFCRRFDGVNCPDGRWPYGGLTYAGAATGALYDGVSPLYGSTHIGGWYGDPGPGTVYSLTPSTGGPWNEKVVYRFCSQENCADGFRPSVGGVIMDSGSHIFGTTILRGLNGQGTVFELLPNAKLKNWSEKTLYAFCSQANCSDGAYGRGALLMDKSGNLFGVAATGGVVCPDDDAGCGVTFELNPNGRQWHYTVLHTFCTLSDCRDGRYPSAGLVMNSAGALLGATGEGGGNDTDPHGKGGGTLYALNGGEAVLHHFCARQNCADGEYPYGGLVMDSAGNIFGTTEYGGSYGGGTVFELSP